MNEQQRARLEAIGAACQYVSGSTPTKREPMVESDLPFVVSLAEYIIGRDDENSPHGADEWRLRAVRAEAALFHTRTERDAARDALSAEKSQTTDPPSGDVADDTDEALARVIYVAEGEDDDGEWGHLSEFAQNDFRRMARAAREHIEDEKSKTGAALYYGAAATRRAEKAEAERDEWEAKFEQTEYERDDWRDKAERLSDMLSRTRDERDSLRHVLGHERDTSAAREEWLRGRHASLRNDVAACRNACQIEDILYRDELWGEQP